jgi:septal ring factor EnvC (AmiA/AmiB activator)
VTPPTKREHLYNPEHPRRPVYFPDITLGNWLTIATMLVAAAGVYAANESRITKVEVIQAADKESFAKQLTTQQESIKSIEGRVAKVDEKIEKVDDKLDELKTLLLQMRSGRR